jgi:hypothetical protein
MQTDYPKKVSLIFLKGRIPYSYRITVGTKAASEAASFSNSFAYRPEPGFSRTPSPNYPFPQYDSPSSTVKEFALHKVVDILEFLLPAGK